VKGPVGPFLLERAIVMNIRFPQSFEASPIRLGVLPAAMLVLVLGTVREAAAQTQLPGPYSSFNANQYSGPLYYNAGYAQYGLPGVGVSPWNPIVQAQLNLGMRTARYNMYSAWADQSNAAANLYYQQAVNQQIQNAKALQAMQPHYDVETRAPRPVSRSNAPAKRNLSKSDVLKQDGQVVWPATLPTSNELDKARSGAESAIRVAVKEFETDGKASISSVAEAKSQLFAYGKPALEQLARANREEAKKLLEFLASLEQVLNSLAGE
jgi:hypothetical protein